MAITKKQTNENASQRAAGVAGTRSQAPTNVKYQTKNSKVEKEPMPMRKMNYILIGVSVLLIVVGFFLMSGSSNEGSTFNDDVFSSTRIVVAPFITFLGFLCMIPAILYKGKRDDDVTSPLDINGGDDPAGNVIVKGK